MVKRGLGLLLFLWMAACMFGVIGEIRNRAGTRLWVTLGAGMFIAAIGLIGLRMTFGKGASAAVSESPDSPTAHPDR